MSASSVRGARRNDSLVTSPPRRHRLWYRRWASWRRRTPAAIGQRVGAGLVENGGWARRSWQAGRCAASVLATPPLNSRPVPVGTRWHAARAGPDTFDKRRRNGKQRAAGDLEGPLFWSRDTLPTLSCRRYTHHATVARYSDYRCSTRIHLDRFIPGGSLENLRGVGRARWGPRPREATGQARSRNCSGISPRFGPGRSDDLGATRIVSDMESDEV